MTAAVPGGTPAPRETTYTVSEGLIQWLLDGRYIGGYAAMWLRSELPKRRQPQTLAEFLDLDDATRQQVEAQFRADMAAIDENERRAARHA